MSALDMVQYTCTDYVTELPPDDAQHEYLLLEEEEDLTSESSGSDNGHISQTNAADFFYLIRHNKKRFISQRLRSSNPLQVNTANNTRVTPCMSATIFRRHGILKLLLSRPEIRVNMFDEHRMSALLYAASNGDQRCLRYLLSAGADPAHANTEQRNVLHLLLLRRHFNSAIYLLEFPDETIRAKIHAILNTPDVYGMTPILYACELGNRSLTKYLVQLGADYQHTDNVGRDALCHAIQSKNPHLVQYFVKELSFDVNYVYTSCFGFTPLFYAASADSPEIIDLLLSCGASIEAREASLKETPLLHAARYGKINALFSLLHNNADPNAENMNGTHALLYLIRNGFHDELYYVYGLQKHLFKPSPPTDIAAIYNSIHTVSPATLYKHLRTINDKQGYTALIHAVLGDNVEAVTFLLNEVKCDIHKGDKQQRSPLYHAVANRFVRLFELLIDAGADFNTKDQDNNTVLMHAVDANNPSFVESLVRRGADLSVLNKDNWSALTFTCKTGNFDLFKLIVREIRDRLPHAHESSPLLSTTQLSLCVNVACVHGRPNLSTGAQGTVRNHLQIITTIIRRSVSSGSTSSLLAECQYADPNQLFEGLEPCIIAAVRNSGDSAAIIRELFASPNAVNLRVTDVEGYTPVLLAVRMQYHTVTHEILSFEASRNDSSGLSTSSTSASSEIRCPNGLTPADHACIIRHEQSYVEVRKRSKQYAPKQNAYKVSTAELFALGPAFVGYLKYMYSLKFPFVQYISRETFVEQCTPFTPDSVNSENEPLLAEIDILWLKDQAEFQDRHGYSFGTSLYELTIPEQSTYTPKLVMSKQGQFIQPLIPRELYDEMSHYTKFLNSTAILDPMITNSNESRPIKSLSIPQYPACSKSMIYHAVVASKNLPLLMALLQFDPNYKPSVPGATGPAVPVPGRPPVLGGVPIRRGPGMPQPVARPGTVAVPMPRGAMPPGSNKGSFAILRTDNINDWNSTLLELLFAFAGFQACSVSGTQFLRTAIICAKYSPHWDPEYIFAPQGTKYSEKRGKTIEELVVAYQMPDDILALTRASRSEIEHNFKSQQQSAQDEKNQ